MQLKRDIRYRGSPSIAAHLVVLCRAGIGSWLLLRELLKAVPGCSPDPGGCRNGAGLFGRVRSQSVIRQTRFNP